jgi:hypothetical protein
MLEQLIYPDIKNNIIDSLPPWFGNFLDDFELNALVDGFAESASFIKNLKNYVKTQTRISTSTGFFLDLAAEDYFGDKLRRHSSENDNSYRQRILSNLLAERVTRTGIYKALLNLTGRPPIMFEPWNPVDTNWLDGGFFCDVSCLGGSVGDFPYQGYIIVFRPAETIKLFNALDVNQFGVDVNFYCAPENQQIITDSDILDLIDRFKAEGVKIWTYIVD